MRGSAATHPPTSAPDGSPQTRRPPAHAGWHTPSHGGGRRRVQHSIQTCNTTRRIRHRPLLHAARGTMLCACKHATVPHVAARSTQQVTVSAAIAPHANLSASRASIHVVTQPNVDSKLTRAGLAELALSKNSTEMPVHGIAAQPHAARQARFVVAASRCAHAQRHTTAC